MTRPRRLAVLCSGLLALSLIGCHRTGGGLQEELPQELLDVLPLGEKRPVEVVLASPQGEIDKLDQAQSIVMSFNQPMVPLRPVSTDVNVDFVDISPKIEGRFRWKGTATLVFEPKVKLPYATRFKVTVKKGVKSWSEQQLPKDFVFQFSSPTVALEHSLPIEGAELQGAQEPLYLHFNQPVKAQDLQGSIQLRQGTQNVDVDVRAYTEEDRKAETKAAEAQDAYDTPKENGLVAGPLENAVVVTAKKPLQAGQSTTVLLLTGIKSPAGPEVTASERSYDFTTRRDFALSSTAQNDLDPENGLYAEFTTQVSPKVLRQAVTVQPSIELPDFSGDDDYKTSTVYLGGHLKPNTTYTITFSDKLVDRYGAKLHGPSTLRVKTGDYRPLLLGPEGSGVLELQGNQKIPYGVRNVSSLTASLRKLTPPEVIQIQGAERSLYSSEAYTPPGGFSKVVDLGGSKRRNEVEQRDLPMPGGGLYYIQTNSSNMSQRSLVSVSDVGVTAKYAAENLLIYATTLKDATPVANAQVQLYSKDGKLHWTGSTNAEGFCQAPGWAKLGLAKVDNWSPPDLWVFVKSGVSESFVHSQGYNSVGPWAFNLDYNSDQTARRFQAFAFSERGVYRPGETVQFKGSLRELSEGSWKLPQVDKVYYKVTDSRDREVSKGELPVNRFGGFDQSLALKPGAITGFYRVEYHLPNSLEKSLKWQETLATVAFQVEAFKPAQFEVTVSSAKPFYVMGDKAEVDIKGWYLFGAPMNERPLSFVARLEPSDLRPEGFEGYDFGLGWDSESQDESKELTTGKQTLDAQGLAHTTILLEKIPFRGSANLVVEGTATAPNRQTLSGRKSIPVYRGEYQLGVRNESSFCDAGKPHKVQVVAVRPEGDTQQGVPVKLELLRRQWNSVRKADESGGYRWVSDVKDEAVSDTEVRTSTTPVDVDLSAPKAGYYVVRASSKDSRGNLIVSESGFYACGNDYVAWERQEDDTIQLVTDKKKYQPGDTATILVKSPYEKTRALVTLEREHVMDRWVVELTGTAPTIKVPLSSRHLPNVYVSVMLLQGRNPKPEFGPNGQDLSKPGFKIGYANLLVEPAEKRLKVEVKTDKQKYAPGDEVVADFQVTDASGAPVEAELCVAVPDQGVLALTGYTLPDWFSVFYGPRPLSITTCETRMDVIGQRAYGTKGANAGGGGGFDAAEGRDDFRYTAYWNPTLTSDVQGKAEVRFKLPDNLTTFRIMAMAQTGNSKFGSAESKFEVQKPLLLQPSMPDFARLGDDFQAGVVVRNNTTESLSVKVSANPEGVTLAGEASQTVTVGAGKEQEVLFHLKAEKLTQAKLSFSAEGGSHQDGLTLPLKLEQAVSLENVSTSGSTAESAAVEMVVPSPMAPGTGVLRLFLSSSALVGLEGPIKDLEDCVWASLEPRLSKIRGALAGQALATALDQDLPEAPLEAWVEDLNTYAREGKGFACWADLDPDAYLTAYTLETLYLAQKAKVPVDAKLIDTARAFLKEFLNSPESYSRYMQPSEVRLVRCFALYALSLGKFDGLSYFNNLLRIRLDIPMEGRIYLLLAGRRLGASAADLALLEQDLINSSKVEASTVYFKDPNAEKTRWTFASDNKLTALALGALLDSPKNYPQAGKVVAWLMEARSKEGDWGNTHDNARVLETLYRYFQLQEKDRPNFEATAFVAKEQVQKVSFVGRQLKVEKSSTPIATSLERLAVGLKKVGPGRLYYEMRLTYAAAKEPPARDEGLAVLKKISTVKGDSFPAQLKAGETYMVTLTVVSPRDRRFVVVNDPIPAGCEVVQTQFETESSEMNRILSLAQSKMENATFVHFEKYDDHVALFADGLQAGEHTFQYLIRANQPGKFGMPATKAEEIYHPEIFGTTTGRVVDIK